MLDCRTRNHKCGLYGVCYGDTEEEGTGEEIILYSSIIIFVFDKTS